MPTATMRATAPSCRSRRKAGCGGRARIPGVYVVDPGGQSFIRHDEMDRFRFGARDIQTQQVGGDTRTIVFRPDGSQIITVIGPPATSESLARTPDAALTVAAAVPLSVTRNVEPDGFENCRPLPPSAAFNCETTDAIPPEKLTPITFGLAFGAFFTGSADGSVTLTMEI